MFPSQTAKSRAGPNLLSISNVTKTANKIANNSQTDENVHSQLNLLSQQSLQKVQKRGEIVHTKTTRVSETHQNILSCQKPSQSQRQPYNSLAQPHNIFDDDDVVTDHDIFDRLLSQMPSSQPQKKLINADQTSQISQLPTQFDSKSQRSVGLDNKTIFELPVMNDHDDQYDALRLADQMMSQAMAVTTQQLSQTDTKSMQSSSRLPPSFQPTSQKAQNALNTKIQTPKPPMDRLTSKLSATNTIIPYSSPKTPAFSLVRKTVKGNLKQTSSKSNNHKNSSTKGGAQPYTLASEDNQTSSQQDHIPSQSAAIRPHTSTKEEIDHKPQHRSCIKPSPSTKSNLPDALHVDANDPLEQGDDSLFDEEIDIAHHNKNDLPASLDEACQEPNGNTGEQTLSPKKSRRSKATYKTSAQLAQIQGGILYSDEQLDWVARNIDILSSQAQHNNRRRKDSSNKAALNEKLHQEAINNEELAYKLAFGHSPPRRNSMYQMYLPHDDWDWQLKYFYDIDASSYFAENGFQLYSEDENELSDDETAGRVSVRHGHRKRNAADEEWAPTLTTRKRRTTKQKKVKGVKINDKTSIAKAAVFETSIAASFTLNWAEAHGDENLHQVASYKSQLAQKARDNVDLGKSTVSSARLLSKSLDIPKQTVKEPKKENISQKVERGSNLLKKSRVKEEDGMKDGGSGKEAQPTKRGRKKLDNNLPTTLDIESNKQEKQDSVAVLLNQSKKRRANSNLIQMAPKKESDSHDLSKSLELNSISEVSPTATFDTNEIDAGIAETSNNIITEEVIMYVDEDGNPLNPDDYDQSELLFE